MSEKIEMCLKVYVLRDKEQVGDLAQVFEIMYNKEGQIWEYTHYNGKENLITVRESENYWRLLGKFLSDLKNFLYLLERRVEYETRSNSSDKRASTD